MIAESRKRFNTWVGVFFMTMGVASFGITGWIVAHPQPPKPHPVSGVPQTDKESCRVALSRLSFMANIQSGDIVAYSSNWDEDPEGVLYKASLGISLCKTLTLKQFCMGDGCKRPGISFTLTGGAEDASAKKDDKKPATPGTPAPAPGTPPKK